MSNNLASGGLHRFTLFVTIAAAVLVGGIGTVLAQHLLSPPDGPRAIGDSAPTASIDPQLALALNGLAQELREARTHSALQPAQSLEPPARTVATESGDSALLELASAVRELRGALQQGSSGPVASSPASVRLPPAGQRAWLPELPDGVKNRAAEYGRTHLFWSEQQVLDSYGLPDFVAIQGSGKVSWFYNDPQEPKRSFTVNVFQGKVVSVGVR